MIMNKCNNITKVTLRRVKKWFKTITKNRVNISALNGKLVNFFSRYRKKKLEKEKANK